MEQKKWIKWKKIDLNITFLYKSILYKIMHRLKIANSDSFRSHIRDKINVILQNEKNLQMPNILFSLFFNLC